MAPTIDIDLVVKRLAYLQAPKAQWCCFADLSICIYVYIGLISILSMLDFVYTDL